MKKQFKRSNNFGKDWIPDIGDIFTFRHNGLGESTPKLRIDEIREDVFISYADLEHGNVTSFVEEPVSATFTPWHGTINIMEK